ncbi:hypothetical protein ACFVFS_11770 [Kitasatospora sp. NPDC057692]|uniref:hypothetical protein n=1 Tax=Kitasatospora sp. NPDC057692 TaxID=3346215 RepID=UPI00367AD656
MYLVHVSLQAPAGAAELPADTRELLLAAAVAEEGIEHVSVHAGALPHPVLGVFVLAARLEEAEDRAQAFCRRATAVMPGLVGWRVRCGRAPLVEAFYERLLDGPGPAGRNGPGPIPST